MMRRCEKCPALVQFVQMVKKDGTPGKVAPIDVDPVPEGNVRVVVLAGQELQGRVLAGQELTWARERGERLHTNHFMTCPEAEHFRRPKAKAVAR